MNSDDRPITVPAFSAMKAAGRKITVLTAYDFTMASLLDSAGVDCILVGDSVATVVQGRPSTLPVTFGEMLYHAEMVGRAVRRALVVFDMPFLSYQVSLQEAIANAGRVLKETACRAVKVEGGADVAPTIAALVRAGIPVMGHVGLLPQSIQVLGKYSLQRDRDRLLADARAVQEAGAFSMVLECLHADIAAEITASVQVPTIGIGAGPGCDGQVLVVNDLLGLCAGRVPRHAKPYADLKTTILDAVRRFGEDVRAGTFPGPEQSFR